MLSDRTEAQFVLPWPVSVNAAWRAISNGRYADVKISKAGRAYRKAVLAEVADTIGKLHEPLFQSYIGVAVYYFPPDNRIRDIDNHSKTPFDALTKANVWADDSLVKQRQEYWCETVTLKKFPEIGRKGMAVVRIWDLPEWEPMEIQEVLDFKVQQKMQLEEIQLDFGVD